MSVRTLATAAIGLTALASSIATSVPETGGWAAHDSFEHAIPLDVGDTTIHMDVFTSRDAVLDHQDSNLRITVDFDFDTATAVEVTAWGPAGSSPETYIVTEPGVRMYTVAIPLGFCDHPGAGDLDCRNAVGIDFSANGLASVDLRWDLYMTGVTPDSVSDIAIEPSGIDWPHENIPH